MLSLSMRARYRELLHCSKFSNYKLYSNMVSGFPPRKLCMMERALALFHHAFFVGCVSVSASKESASVSQALTQVAR
jgi:hypothetical protein